MSDCYLKHFSQKYCLALLSALAQYRNSEETALGFNLVLIPRNSSISSIPSTVERNPQCCHANVWDTRFGLWVSHCLTTVNIYKWVVRTCFLDHSTNVGPWLSLPIGERLNLTKDSLAILLDQTILFYLKSILDRIIVDLIWALCQKVISGQIIIVYLNIL